MLIDPNKESVSAEELNRIFDNLNTVIDGSGIAFTSDDPAQTLRSILNKRTTEALVPETFDQTVLVYEDPQNIQTLYPYGPSVPENPNYIDYNLHISRYTRGGADPVDGECFLIKAAEDYTDDYRIKIENTEAPLYINPGLGLTLSNIKQNDIVVFKYDQSNNRFEVLPFGTLQSHISIYHDQVSVNGPITVAGDKFVIGTPTTHTNLSYRSIFKPYRNHEARILLNAPIGAKVSGRYLLTLKDSNDTTYGCIIDMSATLTNTGNYLQDGTMDLAVLYTTDTAYTPVDVYYQKVLQGRVDLWFVSEASIESIAVLDLSVENGSLITDTLTIPETYPSFTPSSDVYKITESASYRANTFKAYTAIGELDVAAINKAGTNNPMLPRHLVTVNGESAVVYSIPFKGDSVKIAFTLTSPFNVYGYIDGQYYPITVDGKRSAEDIYTSIVRDLPAAYNTLEKMKSKVYDIVADALTILDTEFVKDGETKSLPILVQHPILDKDAMTAAGLSSELIPKTQVYTIVPETVYGEESRYFKDTAKQDDALYPDTPYIYSQGIHLPNVNDLFLVRTYRKTGDSDFSVQEAFSVDGKWMRDVVDGTVSDWRRVEIGTDITIQTQVGAKTITSSIPLELHYTWHQTESAEIKVYADGRVFVKGSVIPGTVYTDFTEVEMLHGIRELHAGDRHLYAKKADGTWYGIGDNTEGQLAFIGSALSYQTLTPLAEPYRYAVRIVSERSTTFVEVNHNHWEVAGNNLGRKTGLIGMAIDTPTAIPYLFDVRSLNIGNRHTVYIKNDGYAYAIGDNTNGVFSETMLEVHTDPLLITDYKVTDIATGDNYTVLKQPNNIVEVRSSNGNIPSGTYTNIAQVYTTGNRLLFTNYNDETLQVLGETPIIRAYAAPKKIYSGYNAFHIMHSDTI